jgi:hypothetical protein
MENSDNSFISNGEEQFATPIRSNNSYELPPTTIRLIKNIEYVFSLHYNIETNNDDGKTHYYRGKYDKQKNGEPVFKYLIDTETLEIFRKITIENFVLLKPQIINWMGVIRGKIRKEQEELRIKHDKEREEREKNGGRMLGFSAIDLMKNPGLYNW